PDVTVDAAALVPPALEGARVDVDRQHVRRAGVRDPADVVAERRVAALLLAEELPVQPELAVAEDAVEVEPEALPAGRGRKRKGLPVPGGRRRAETVVLVRLRVDRLFDHVVVR